jgi:hypothetical protein
MKRKSVSYLTSIRHEIIDGKETLFQQSQDIENLCFALNSVISLDNEIRQNGKPWDTGLKQVKTMAREIIKQVTHLQEETKKLREYGI